ncbi:MAG: MFS transporter [Treponema sp.]|nr:MFS transporter [Treponema sp.]
MYSLLLVIIYISFISLGLPDSLLGSAWPSMYPQFAVPVSYAGIISMVIAGGTIISSFFSDKLVRRLGTGKITAVSVGMTAAAIMGFSCSSHFWMICIWAVPYGLGAGSVDAALNNFVALHYKARHMNWLHCFWGIGATVGPYIMGMCLTHQQGWTGGYRIISIIQIVLTLILAFSLPLWKVKPSESSSAGEEKHPRVLSVKQLLALPSAKGILVAFFCYCALETTTGLWGGSYMVLQKGISKELAASLSSIFYLGITGGRALSGFVSMKLTDRQMIRTGQGCIVAGICVLLFSGSMIVMSTGFVLIGLGCAPVYPGLLHQTPERFGKDVSQAVMGMQMASAYIGSTFMPPLAGFIMGKVSSAVYPFLLLFFVILMTVLVEVSDRRSSRSR